MIFNNWTKRRRAFLGQKKIRADISQEYLFESLVGSLCPVFINKCFDMKEYHINIRYWRRLIGSRKITA